MQARQRRDRPDRRETVLFDETPGGTSLGFGPGLEDRVAEAPTLRWTVPASPELIDEVVQLVVDRRLAVDTIVIGGLERYPVAAEEWPKWLVRWGLEAHSPRIVVWTRDLSRRDRRRLIRRTRRRAQLRRPSNPVVRLTKAIRHWFVGRRA